MTLLHSVWSGVKLRKTPFLSLRSGVFISNHLFQSSLSRGPMEPEPAAVPAEPVHEPEDNRDLMRHKLFTNLAAVGGLADLGELAHRVQPGLVPVT